MQKLLLLLCTSWLSAQIVNIPDSAFKTKLLSIGVDTNGDGQIQLSEAQSLTTLDIAGAGISSLVGIQSFSNVQTIHCEYNQLTNVDISGMAQLQEFWANNNNISIINVTGCNSLQILWLSDNQLSSIDLAGLVALESLYLDNNQFSGGFEAACPSLEILSIKYNAITSADISGCHNLAYAYFSYCQQLSSLNASGCSLLEWLFIDHTQLSTLNLTGCALLGYIGAFNLAATSLTLSDLPNLQVLNGNYSPNLTALSVQNCPVLTQVNFHNCNLQSLIIQNCPSMMHVKVAGNQLTSLDLSAFTQLSTITIAQNPLLNLNIKNGSTETILGTFNLPTLQYVCADESQLLAFQSYSTSMPNAVINSYCSFTPGGHYNTITGNILLDLEGDGCNTSDVVPGAVQINVADASATGSLYSNTAGLYNIYTIAANTIITPQLGNGSYFSITPSSQTASFQNTNNNVAQMDFCITPNGVHPDVEVTIVPIDQPRPGFDSHYKVICRNKGNQILSGSLSFSYDESITDFISSIPSPVQQSTGNLVFSYSDLSPFQYATFNVTLNLNSPMETPPVNLGDNISLTAYSTVASDGTPADNSFTLPQTVVGSYDPNDKHCLQGEIVSDSTIGEYLHYVINFENTGTAAAENIVVKDVINTQMYDLNTFEFVGSSHPVVVRRTAEKLEFIHEGIQLAPQGTGYVLFKIKTNASLTSGATVANKADIFFDYNWPIETNLAQTTFQSLGTASHNIIGFAVYPNPAGNSLNLQSSEAITSASIFDASGRTVMTAKMQDKSAAMDVSTLSAGIYFIRIATASGSAVQKFKKL